MNAVVFDAPVLLYYTANEGKGRAQLVGPPFQKEDYGIVFQDKDALRKQVNGVLLTQREDGTYQQIYRVQIQIANACLLKNRRSCDRS